MLQILLKNWRVLTGELEIERELAAAEEESDDDFDEDEDDFFDYDGADGSDCESDGEGFP